MGGDGEAMGGRAFILQNFQGAKKIFKVQSIKEIRNISLVSYIFLLGGRGRAIILQNFQSAKKIEHIYLALHNYCFAFIS